MSFTTTTKNNKIGEQITKEAMESPLKISVKSGRQLS